VGKFDLTFKAIGSKIVKKYVNGVKMSETAQRRLALNEPLQLSE